MARKPQQKLGNAGYSLQQSSAPKQHIDVLKHGEITASVRIPDKWLECRISTVQLGTFENGIAPLNFISDRDSNFQMKYPCGITKSGIVIDADKMTTCELRDLSELIYNDPSKLATLDLDQSLKVLDKDIDLIKILRDIAGHGYEAQLESYKESFSEGARSLLPDTAKEHFWDKQADKLNNEYNNVCHAFNELNNLSSSKSCEYELTM